jgi:hypothetical protein
MRHTWKLLGFWTIVLGALSAAPSPAQNSDGAENKATAPENATEILKELRALNKRLDTLERNLENDLRELRTRGTQTDLAVQTAQKDVNDLKGRLDQLRRDIDSLNRRLGPVERIATYAGPAGTAAPPPPPGRVRIVNTYFVPETVVVNGKAYTVAPYDVVFTDPVPAGPFSYEVVNVQARQDRLLNPSETFSIYVHPR